MVGSVLNFAIKCSYILFYFVIVKVYVKLHHNSPVLVCMDFKRAEKETVDPTYLWVGPNEKPLTGKLFDFNVFF